MFLRKKSGATPRPIRIGELWRRVIAKRVLHDNRSDIQQACLSARQFGVAVSGGAERLVHFRTLIERHFSFASEEIAIIDVDFKSAFPSLEWDSIREAIDELLPGIASWTHWSHLFFTRVVLPSGEELRCDRGAEQGDPLGPIYYAFVLSMMMRRTRAALEHREVSLFDAWFLDDGQLACHLQPADLVLRTLDVETAR